MVDHQRRREPRLQGGDRRQPLRVGEDLDVPAELADARLDPADMRGEVLVPANLNCPGQVVISGTQAACDAAVEAADQHELRATALNVAGGFHSPVMKPAADRLAQALDEVSWQSPQVPVYANVTGEPHESDPESIKQRLVEQLTHPVRWSNSMQNLLEAQPDAPLLEMAPGKVLSGLMRRIDRNRKVERHDQPTDD